MNRLRHIKKPGRLKNGIIFLATICYLLVSLVFVSKQEYFIFLLAPALLLLLLALISIDNFFLLLLLLTPLSVQLRFLYPDLSVDLFLPTEPMLALLLIIVSFKLFVAGEGDRNFLKKPLTILIGISLGWMFLTSFTGTDILVSLKYSLARLWFVSAFYLLSYELFRKAGFMEKSFKFLVAGMIPVIVYHLVRLGAAGLFNRQAAHSSTWPFFNDHTSFGAAVAFLLPLVIYFICSSRKTVWKLLYLSVLVIFIAGLVFSYSRAAWLSLAVAILFSLVYLLKIPMKLAGVWLIVIIAAGILSWSSIITGLKSNTQDSSANMLEHLNSISNISSDNSNLERINRWKCALRMMAEKPLLGTGPGTYQFEYAPYQLSHERSGISTNFGDGGNAHSEYLGAMSDSGIPAGLFYILILIMAFRMVHRAWKESPGLQTRFLSLALMAGIMTYVVHGGLNNFLDTDKISAPFWMFLSALLSLHPAKNKELLSTSPEL